MWSIGCTLYELYTGKILFPGRSNNHMLLLVQELKGRYPGRLVKKAKFGEVHFEESSFVHVEKDKNTGAVSVSASPFNTFRGRNALTSWDDRRASKRSSFLLNLETI